MTILPIILSTGNKKRIIRIPTIKDRAVQNLFKLIIEPIVKVSPDFNSSCFWPNLSALQAITIVKNILNNKWNFQDLTILNSSIKEFFDNVSHNWILNNFPISFKYQNVLHNWLKVRYKYNKNFQSTRIKVPQNNLLAPLIISYVLNELGKVIKKAILIITKSKIKVKIDKLTKNVYKIVKKFKIYFVRYVDDFLVIIIIKHSIAQYVKLVIEKFINICKIKLSSKKIKTYVLGEQDLNFLGYHFKYKKVWEIKVVYFNEKYKKKIKLLSQKTNKQNIPQKLKNIFHKNLNLNVISLIKKVNTVITEWLNYFNFKQSYKMKNKLKCYVFKLCWNWAKKKHSKWGKKKIVKMYFIDKTCKLKSRKWLLLRDSK